MDSRYPISLVKINPLTLELLPLLVFFLSGRLRQVLLYFSPLTNSTDSDKMSHFAAFHLGFQVCKSTWSSFQAAMLRQYDCINGSKEYNLMLFT